MALVEVETGTDFRLDRPHLFLHCLVMRLFIWPSRGAAPGNCNWMEVSLERTD